MNKLIIALYFIFILINPLFSQTKEILTQSSEVKILNKSESKKINLTNKKNQEDSKVKNVETNSGIGEIINDFQKMTYETFLLKNGIESIYQKRESLPMVIINIAIGGGSSIENRKYSGITRLLLRSMLKNVKIKRKLDNNGAKIECSVQKNFSVIKMKSRSENFLENLGLLSDLLLKPDLSRRIVNSESKKQKDEIDMLGSFEKISNKLYGKLFTDTGYSINEIGSKKTISRTAYTKVREWYRKLFVSANMKIFIIGDIDESKVKNLVETSFGGVKNGGKFLKIRIIGESDNKKVMCSEKNISGIAYRVAGIDSDDYYYLKFLTFILNEEKFSFDFTSWYPTTIGSASFMIIGEFKEEDIEKLVDEIMQTIKNNSNFNELKDKFIVEYLNHYSSMDETINYITTYRMCGKSSLFPQLFIKKIKELKFEDILKKSPFYK